MIFKLEAYNPAPHAGKQQTEIQAYMSRGSY